MSYTVHDVEGQRFGHLTAIRFDHRTGNRYYWLCMCDCGKECCVNRYNLISGKTRSCGHLRSNNANMVRGRFHHVNIDDSVKRWIIKNYIHTKNKEIKDRFGLTDGWLHRFARENGLKKSTQFVHKCQREAAAAAKASHLKNGTYPPKGHSIPGSSSNPIQLYIARETKKTESQPYCEVCRDDAEYSQKRASPDVDRYAEEDKAHPEADSGHQEEDMPPA